MVKLIFCNLDMLKDKPDEEGYENYDLTRFDLENFKTNRDIFIRKFAELSKESNNKILFYSRKIYLLNEYQKKYFHMGYKNFQFKDRRTIESFVKNNQQKNNYFVFIGGKNVDFQLAVNTRSLFIVPTWLPLEEKPKRYGIHVDKVKHLVKFIRTMNNQNVWYSKVKIDDITTAYSLVDARYGKYAKTAKEKEMVSNFQRVLKEHQSLNYQRILLYHFLAGMTSNMVFDDIEIFGMIPASNCEVNEYVFDFMTQVRLLKGKKLPKRYTEDFPPAKTNLLIRHTIKNRNHNGGRGRRERIDLGAKDEFRTLMVNPDYKKRIKKLRKEGRFNVCIFDDYMTHGNSFNAVRNLLEAIGANKIICVSIGIFMSTFQKRDYIITGDVFGPNYSYEIENYEPIDDYKINNSAKQEVSDLYNIFNS